MSAQIICVHTSKGGTGKSTITTILASYLTYELSKRVLQLMLMPHSFQLIACVIGNKTI
ncbi:MAG: hypothetical protein R2822_29945 [Spirosomataceae bacterium]